MTARASGSTCSARRSVVAASPIASTSPGSVILRCPEIRASISSSSICERKTDEKRFVSAPA